MKCSKIAAILLEAVVARACKIKLQTTKRTLDTYISNKWRE
jgi:hypothetical protein